MRVAPHRYALALWLATAVLPPCRSLAAPVSVRIVEGYTHGFVDFFSGRQRIGQGELVQFPRDGAVENRLTASFDDGSLHDETVVFTQDRVFRLRSYRLIQRGPSFPETADVTFDDSGRYRVRLRKGGEREESADGHTEIPPDVYNGLTSTLLKNLAAGATAQVQQLAFTPKPRLLDVTLLPDAEEPFTVGTEERTAARYRVRLRVAGPVGVIARLIGKDPPDVSFWMAKGPAPTFVRFEGPLAADAPVWRAELGAPRWIR